MDIPAHYCVMSVTGEILAHIPLVAHILQPSPKQIYLYPHHLKYKFMNELLIVIGKFNIDYNSMTEWVQLRGLAHK